MKKKSLFVKIIGLIMICVLSIQICSTQMYAASKNWRLSHNPNGTLYENILSWDKTVVTTKSTTKGVVDAVGGGATIRLHSSNGISSDYSSAGSCTVSSAVGRDVALSVTYLNYGNRQSNPSGYFVY